MFQLQARERDTRILPDPQHVKKCPSSYESIAVGLHQLTKEQFQSAAARSFYFTHTPFRLKQLLLRHWEELMVIGRRLPLRDGEHHPRYGNVMLKQQVDVTNPLPTFQEMLE